MTVLYTDIGELVTNDPTLGDGSPLGVIHDAAMVVGGWRRSSGLAVAPTRRMPTSASAAPSGQRHPRIRRQPRAPGVRR